MAQRFGDVHVVNVRNTGYRAIVCQPKVPMYCKNQTKTLLVIVLDGFAGLV